MTERGRLLASIERLIAIQDAAREAARKSQEEYKKRQKEKESQG